MNNYLNSEKSKKFMLIGMERVPMGYNLWGSQKWVGAALILLASIFNAMLPKEHNTWKFIRAIWESKT